MEELLEKLQRPTSATELRNLAAKVRTHAEMLDEESLSIPHIDYELAQSVATALLELVQDVEDMTPDDRAAVAVAARYFVLTEDEASDLDVDGLFDDAEMVRLVCERVGRSDLAELVARG
ncbi:MAG TPA: hypothetical protein VL068_08725 [Microthrixaceae bacterium]|nr:hypothetical protein [Microthrixaceae bacterium]